ncbi:hypothetical protein [Telluribacter sp.]|jgi:hypothetical protein|uniref:hypothetical protein n=1 Tax=Telluribacter sp. TaxID=1978767 RepID=UPI002E107947|nr:hypothetical protein [Telluribacter sp.]
MEFIVILVLAALLQFFLPWWVIALVPFLVCMWLSKNGWRAFFFSLVAVGVLWLGYAWYLHNQTAGVMSDRISRIFFLPNGLAMAGVAALIGGLVAGFAGLAGFQLKNMFRKKDQLVYRR